MTTRNSAEHATARIAHHICAGCGAEFVHVADHWEHANHCPQLALALVWHEADAAAAEEAAQAAGDAAYHRGIAAAERLTP